MSSDEEMREKRLSKWKRPINKDLIFSGTASAPSFAIKERGEDVTVASTLGTHIWTTKTSEESLKKEKKEKKGSVRYQYTE